MEGVALNISRIVLLTAVVLIVILGGRFLLRARSLAPVVQSHRSYTADIVSDATNIDPGKEWMFTYRIRNDRGEALKDFAVVHEKIMHLIVVRKDLQNFQHLHPDFSPATGEFSLAVVFPTDGPYRLFPDFTPARAADNPQLLPVTVFADAMVGDQSRYQPQPVTADTETKERVGEYEVTHTFPGSPVNAAVPLTYSLSVAQNGQPVTDLEPYLGARGHSVILRADTLDFIHTHAEEDGKIEGPQLTFSTTFPGLGLYKIFTQFQHAGSVYTADYAISIDAASGETRGAEHQQH